jgi:hypothetical protein
LNMIMMVILRKKEVLVDFLGCIPCKR